MQPGNKSIKTLDCALCHNFILQYTSTKPSATWSVKYGWTNEVVRIYEAAMNPIWICFLHSWLFVKWVHGTYFRSRRTSNLELEVFFGVAIDKLANKRSSCRWFEMPGGSCDVTVLTLRTCHPVLLLCVYLFVWTLDNASISLMFLGSQRSETILRFLSPSSAASVFLQLFRL